MRGVFHQTTRVPHFVHHRVAHVNAGCTANALVLQPFSDVYARGANLHTQRAINAGTQIELCQIRLAGTCATRFTPFLVVGDDEGVFVEHGTLKAGIGAHVFAHLFAHEASIAIGCETVKPHPKNFPGPHGQSHHFCGQVANRGEITHKGKTGPQRQAEPNEMLQTLAAEFRPRHGPRVEPHAG